MRFLATYWPQLLAAAVLIAFQLVVMYGRVQNRMQCKREGHKWSDDGELWCVRCGYEPR